MTELRLWCCVECGAVLGWQDGGGLSVDKGAVDRYALPSHSEEIWVTCKACGHTQMWRAQVELKRPDAEPEQLAGG
jgi:ribosomal protein S27E